MKGLNKIVLIGNVAREPELKYTSTGTPVAKFTLAVEDSWKSGTEKKTSTNWIPVVVWEALAEKVVGKYVTKGMRLAVEGRIRTFEYVKDGEKRYGFEVVADGLVMLDSKPVQQPAATNADGTITDDDIPF